MIIGGTAWLVSFQYFIAQIIVTNAWFTPFSLRDNFISDLGNTTCGIYAGNYVCSPLYALMNGAFVLYGITMIIGAIALGAVFADSIKSKIAFGLMVLAGVGTCLVGLFPEDTVMSLHQGGALLGLGVGNISVILIGICTTRLGRWLRTYTIISGVIATAAFVLFASGIYLGLGVGGMERVASYIFTIWMTLFGLILLLSKKHTL